MPVFKASKIRSDREMSPEEVLALFCYYFPQYTIAQAKLFPYKRIALMLKIVRKEKAKDMIDLLYVSAGSHSKKGYADVLSYFKKIIEE